MKTCREQLEEAFESHINYYKNSQEREIERRLDAKSYRVAEIIDAMLAVDHEGFIEADASYSMITIRFTTVNNSRKFASRILDRFKLNEIQKRFYTYTEEVVWYYNCILGNGHNVEIKIFPCEPSSECSPVRVSEGYTKYKWVCSQTGEEL